MTTAKRATNKDRLRVELPPLIPDVGVTWEYRLSAEGFEVEVSIELPDRTISMSNTMSWETFIHGLAAGWEKYHQNNADFTRLIDNFIRQQIAEGHYTVKGQEQHGKKGKATAERDATEPPLG